MQPPVTGNNNNNVEQRFFNEHRSANAAEAALVGFIKRKNEKQHFVATTVSRIGYPRWDKALSFTKPATAGKGNSAESTTITYIPFVRDSQNYVNATMVIQSNPVDTSFSYNCDWQYAQKQNSLNSYKDTAEYYAVFFMVMDNRVFGHKKFAITDSSIFGNENFNAVYINFDTTQNAGRSAELTPTEFCQEFQITFPVSCYGNSQKQITSKINTTNIVPGPVCYGQISYEYCWTEYVESGGSGGNTGDGTGGDGGATGGEEGGTPDECNPNPTEGGRISSNLPACGPGWEPVPIEDEPPPEDPCSTSDAYLGTTATSQYLGLSSTVQQFAPFDPNTTTQHEQYFTVDNINGTNVPGPIETLPTTGGSIAQSVTPNTIMVVHTHPYGGIPGPSAGDFFDLASYGSNFQISYIVAFDGTKYAMVVNNISQFQQFAAFYASSLNPDGTLIQNSPLGEPFYGLRQLLISQGYSYDEAHERSLAFIMRQAGITLTKASIGSNTFKKIGIRQKLINGVPQTDSNGLPIYENADCP